MFLPLDRAEGGDSCACDDVYVCLECHHFLLFWTPWPVHVTVYLPQIQIPSFWLKRIGSSLNASEDKGESGGYLNTPECMIRTCCVYVCVCVCLFVLVVGNFWGAHLFDWLKKVRLLHHFPQHRTTFSAVPEGWYGLCIWQ